MPYLVSAVVFVGLLGLVNLLLTLALIRRHRQHAEVLRALGLPPPFTAPGTTLPEFTTTDTGGDTVTRSFFTASTVVGMFSTTCAGCEDRLPEFTETVRDLGAGRVMALVVGSGEKATAFAARLSPVATVVIEEPNGPLYAAFGRPPFPGFYVVDADATVTASTGSPADLPVEADA